jgi:aminoglycoside phosphotransferase family enzyme
VFLVDGDAFKLKKPVRDALVDFSTPDLRRCNAEEEVRLNRRLAPDAYIGVVPLTRTANGELAIGGRGTPVDWLVHMRRLPESRFLDALIARKAVRHDDIRALSRTLAVFYEGARLSGASCEEYLSRLRQDVLAARTVLVDRRFGLSHSRVRMIAGRVLHFLADGDGPLAGYASSRVLVEGHGDLRPEHVWLGDRPIVIDCLEFDRSLRILDPFDEVGFLALECERLGAKWIGRLLLEEVQRSLKAPPRQIVQCFRASRALIRASFALRHFLAPPPYREPAKWLRQARSYLALAEKDSAGL